MDSGVSKEIIADGEWHLYEWDLDSVVDWGVVPGIGGGHGGFLLDVTHAIDSIWFRDTDGTLGPDATIDFDFVALNRLGSIADLVPEPSDDDADFDADGDIDGADFLAWQIGLGISDGSANLADGDANDDGNVTAADLAVWQTQFATAVVAASAVPEPATLALAGLALIGGLAAVRRK